MKGKDNLNYSEKNKRQKQLLQLAADLRSIADQQALSVEALVKEVRAVPLTKEDILRIMRINLKQGTLSGIYGQEEVANQIMELLKNG